MRCERQIVTGKILVLLGDVIMSNTCSLTPVDSLLAFQLSHGAVKFNKYMYKIKKKLCPFVSTLSYAELSC